MDRYSFSKALLNKPLKKRYREATIMPTLEKTPEDIYVISVIEDRLDTLAHTYYKNVLMWVVIAAANPDISFSSLYLEPGLQIRIPSIDTAANFMIQLDELNSKR